MTGISAAPAACRQVHRPVRAAWYLALGAFVLLVSVRPREGEGAAGPFGLGLAVGVDRPPDGYVRSDDPPAAIAGYYA